MFLFMEMDTNQLIKTVETATNMHMAVAEAGQNDRRRRKQPDKHKSQMASQHQVRPRTTQ